MMSQMIGVLKRPSGDSDPLWDDVMILAPFDETAGTASGWEIYGALAGESWNKTNVGSPQSVIETSSGQTLFGNPTLRLYKTSSATQQYISLASKTELALASTDSLTLEFFFYRVSSGNFTTAPLFVHYRHRDGSNNYTADLTQVGNYSTSKAVQIIQNAPAAYYPTQLSGYAGTNGVWSHFAYVFDAGAGQVSVYLEGTRVGQYSLGRTSTASADLFIGGFQNTTTGEYDSYIAQLRLTRAVRYSGTTLTVPTAAFPRQ